MESEVKMTWITPVFTYSIQTSSTELWTRPSKPSIRSRSKELKTAEGASTEDNVSSPDTNYLVPKTGACTFLSGHRCVVSICIVKYFGMPRAVGV